MGKILDLLEKSELWKNREAFKKGAKEPWLNRAWVLHPASMEMVWAMPFQMKESARIELDQDGFFTLLWELRKWAKAP